MAYLLEMIPLVVEVDGVEPDLVSILAVVDLVVVDLDSIHLGVPVGTDSQ